MTPKGGTMNMPASVPEYKYIFDVHPDTRYLLVSYEKAADFSGCLGTSHVPKIFQETV